MADLWERLKNAEKSRKLWDFSSIIRNRKASQKCIEMYKNTIWWLYIAGLLIDRNAIYMFISSLNASLSNPAQLLWLGFREI